MCGTLKLPGPIFSATHQVSNIHHHRTIGEKVRRMCLHGVYHYLTGVCENIFFTLRLRPRPGRLSLKVETETFGCWYRKLRLRLRLLVVGIKSWDWDWDFWLLVSWVETETETFQYGLKYWDWDFSLWSQKLRPRLRLQICGLKAWDQPSLDTKTMFKKELLFY